MSPDPPTVLFVCVHNAGRSQMAAGWLTQLAGDRIDVRSAGSEPADQLNPVAIEAMQEVGIDIAAQRPKLLTTDAVSRADAVITMGCGDTCPYYPGKRYEDWDLTDPAGQPIEVVRQVRDDIKTRVAALVEELLDEPPPDPSLCWCCGSHCEPDQMVHLGHRPEVAVCTRCAHSLSKWAGEIEDESRTGILVHARREFRRARKYVVRRGWHRNKIVGRGLRWIGRFTP